LNGYYSIIHPLKNSDSIKDKNCNLLAVWVQYLQL